VQSIYSLGASDAHQALNSKYETFATGHFSPLPVRAPRARDMNNVHREVDKAIKGASKRIKHSKVPPFDESSSGPSVLKSKAPSFIVNVSSGPSASPTPRKSTIADNSSSSSPTVSAPVQEVGSTDNPSYMPVIQTTARPSLASPTKLPTDLPTSLPTPFPMQTPSAAPSEYPLMQPTADPSTNPSSKPAPTPIIAPSNGPSIKLTSLSPLEYMPTTPPSQSLPLSSEVQGGDNGDDDDTGGETVMVVFLTIGSAVCVGSAVVFLRRRRKLEAKVDVFRSAPKAVVDDNNSWDTESSPRSLQERQKGKALCLLDGEVAAEDLSSSACTSVLINQAFPVGPFEESVSVEKEGVERIWNGLEAIEAEIAVTHVECITENVTTSNLMGMPSDQVSPNPLC